MFFFFWWRSIYCLDTVFTWVYVKKVSQFITLCCICFKAVGAVWRSPLQDLSPPSDTETLPEDGGKQNRTHVICNLPFSANDSRAPWSVHTQTLIHKWGNVVRQGKYRAGDLAYTKKGNVIRSSGNKNPGRRCRYLQLRTSCRTVALTELKPTNR